MRIFAKVRSSRTGSQRGSKNAVGATRRVGRGSTITVGAVLALAFLTVGAGSAVAAEPVFTVDPVATAGLTTAEVSGTVDPQDNEVFYYFEYSKDPDAEGWTPGPEAFTRTLPPGSGVTPVSETLTNLRAGTEYKVRLTAFTTDFTTQWSSEAPYRSFTTDPVAAPTVELDPITTHTDTTAHLSGAIKPNAPAGTLSPEEEDAYRVHWHFECSPECPSLEGEPNPAVEAWETEKEVKVDVTGLEPNTAYSVSLVASNAGEEVSDGPQGLTTGVSAPAVNTLPAFAIRGGTEALVGGSVNPRNSATTYWIEWGPTASYGHKLPVVPADAGSGGQLEYVTQRLAGLSPSTVYHVQLVAKSDAGESKGPDVNFETAPAGAEPSQNCPNQQLRIENNSTALPDCRAYEQVSPTDKNGFDAGNIQTNVYQVAEDGSRVEFEAFGAFANPASSPIFSTYLSHRSEAGWVTQMVTPPEAPQPAPTRVPFENFTPNLDQSTLVTQPGVNISPGDRLDASNLYLRDNVNGTYTTLNASPLLGDEPPRAGGYRTIDMTPDAKHVVFTSNVRLTSDAPTNSNQLYEWDNGQLRLASVLPSGEPVEAFEPRGAGVSLGPNYISDDGSRIVFGTPSGNPQDGGKLYVREDGQRTIAVSASQKSEPEDESGNLPTYWGMSADGSQIFFSSPNALTDDATAGVQSLYRYDLDTGVLTDLTPTDQSNFVGGGVVGVYDVSKDGSQVYFVSTRRYVPGNGVDGKWNVYRWHSGSLSFVLTDDVGSTSVFEAGYRTAHSTPDGEHLIFMSSGRLTAYDNTDVATGQPDSEVYLYSASTNRLTCISCDSSGDLPQGPAALPPPHIWQLTNGPARDLTSDGSRAVFTTKDALVPADVNGKTDAYIWEAGTVHLLSSGSGGSDSLAIGLSKSGDDAFVNTRDQSVPSDHDGLIDVYDARVGGGFPQPPPESACEGIEGCHGPPSRSPSSADPGSSATAAQPMLSPRRRRLRAALRSCRKKHPKKVRVRCRAKAKKHFKTAGRTH